MSVRSAISGRFASKNEAKKSPKTTVTEKAPSKPAPKADAPKRVRFKECPGCNGRGLNLLDYSKLCAVCHGSGKA